MEEGVERVTLHIGENGQHLSATFDSGGAATLIPR